MVYVDEMHELQVREWEIQARCLFLRGVEKPTLSKLEDLVSDILIGQRLRWPAAGDMLCCSSSGEASRLDFIGA